MNDLVLEGLLIRLADQGVEGVGISSELLLTAVSKSRGIRAGELFGSICGNLDPLYG